MSWFLQTPDSASPKLLKNIMDQCGPAERGGAAFAFASAQGVKLLGAEPMFSKFLKASEFTIIVGLDAITDTRAVDELRKLSKSHPNFKPKLFLHSMGGSLFHPKTMWLKTSKGGVIITGSGNLTSGGLKSNWEATAVQTLTPAEIAEAVKSWDAWLKTHKNQIVDLDDGKAIEKAKANEVVRSRIKKVLKKPGAEEEPADQEVDAIAEIVEDIEDDFSLNPVLIAEAPGGGRWKQVGFSLEAYEQFFGVTLGKKKHVRFYQVNSDGSLEPVENSESVAVKSKNYRFEIRAAQGLPYPKKGHPIVVFEKISDSDFKYILRMPGNPEHTLIQDFLDKNYSKSRAKRRIQITAGDLEKVWPTAPFFH
ncbi:MULTISPECIES: phospholipase D family protein [unclassified Beijerinckia]|uniref:phospholipase D family protein n=1 Tax=unclassified Beijerinckia TaxID=2638183 RepID=UPI000895C8A9|nr:MULTISPECIES: phospholipase D family protein [unclassified Beijerinckia]MDH7798417.1 HKD family nuclease [Beijerinckia sp. GAS462]SED20162.1 hypothetical protein SAMN05443249_4714 [Beijerinckia sp. 28-YEA-48]